jgi:hypothetical protein
MKDLYRRKWQWQLTSNTAYKKSERINVGHTKRNVCVLILKKASEKLIMAGF